MLTEEEWRELEKEFERGYKIFEQATGPGFFIQEELKKQKVGKGKIKLDFVLKDDGLIGAHSDRYDEKIEELSKKVTDFVTNEGLKIDTTVSNGL